ncbi:DUF6230 family protein [Streptomyces sp. NPDC026673]|uniref:DUF6230 family protein n=1 Tax=Streptomyces sp. NPDC026673 TaxID=3155724 RepID=UPI0033EB0CA9
MIPPTRRRSRSGPCPSDRTGRSGRTSWTRTAVVLVPTLAVATAAVIGMGAGMVPVSMAISPAATALSGHSIQVAADTLTGRGFTQYVTVDSTAAGDFPQAVSAIGSADLHNLCQSVVGVFPGFGEITLRITAGTDGRPVHAERLIVDTDDLTGDAEFHDIRIGVDASRTDTEGRAKGPAGAPGLQAESVRIDRLRQTAKSVSAATFTLNGLHMTVDRGAKPCF